MNDFIEFLNLSDAETLSKMEGLTAVQVESILSSRPFTSLEDCTRISEMTKRKLTLIKKKWQEQSSMSTAESPVDEKPNVEETPASEPIVIEKTPEEPSVAETPSEPEQVKPEPQKSNVLRRVLIWLLVLVLLASAVYAGIVYGLPFLYDKYVKPVETNAENITDLAAQQENEITRLNDEITALTDEITTLQERATELESRADGFDKSLTSHAESLAQLEKMQTLLDQQMKDQQDDLFGELDRQVKFTRALELISRSRLYLSQGNYGLAKDDLQASRKLLYTMLETLPTDQQGAMSIVIDRLDMALENLPNYPVVAVYDVDTAWQLLVDGLPNVPTQVVTPIVLPEEATPTLTATAEIQATETPAVTPTR